MQVESVLRLDAQLGESPVWCDRDHALWFVDIKAPAVHRFEPATGALATLPMPADIGSIGLRRTDGLVAALRTGFALVETATGEVRPITDPIGGRPDLRFNDGRCDRAGRFWAGTVQERRVAGEAALYRLEPDHRCAVAVPGLTVVNAVAFAPDGRTLYVACSHARELMAFDLDPATGDLGRRRTLHRLADRDGVPDGATVDEAGCLWLAVFDGGRLLRLTPDGRIDREVAMPVPRPTSCTFGGPGLDTLYVTTARTGLSPAQLADAPLSGSVLACRPGVRGLPEPRFAG